jgi:thioredoxin 1
MAGENIVTLTTANWGSEVLESDVPVLIDVWAPWCAPCRLIEPIVKDFATEYAGRVKIGKLNADENASILMQYGIMSLPTLVVFRGGKPVNAAVGFRPKPELKKFLDQSIA